MIGPVINFASGYIQSLITGAAKGSSSTNTAAGNTQGANQLSPFAQILSSLQQVEQSNPLQYQQVTKRISTNLATTSQAATASGNPALAGELSQLSTDFKNASTSGQLPSIHDLVQVTGSGGYHHLHNSVSSSRSALSSQAAASANPSLNALSIIDNTLSSAGIPIG